MNTPLKRPYSDQFLANYSKHHVAYEISMFFNTKEAFASTGIALRPINNQQARFLSNLLTESYANHLRNLIDFFYPRNGKPKPTDIVAGDYCLGDNWSKAAPVMSSVLLDARTRADKEIAHLTSSRITGSPPQKHWSKLKHSTEIKALLQLYVQTAVPNRLDAKIITIIHAL